MKIADHCQSNVIPGQHQLQARKKTLGRRGFSVIYLQVVVQVVDTSQLLGEKRYCECHRLEQAENHNAVKMDDDFSSLQHHQ